MLGLVVRGKEAKGRRPILFEYIGMIAVVLFMTGLSLKIYMVFLIVSFYILSLVYNFKKQYWIPIIFTFWLVLEASLFWLFKAPSFIVFILGLVITIILSVAISYTVRQGWVVKLGAPSDTGGR